MASIKIDGTRYRVCDSLGYLHDVGSYVKEVETENGPKMAVKQGGRWRFWTAIDRIAPLIEGLALKEKERKERGLAMQWDDAQDSGQ